MKDVTRWYSPRLQSDTTLARWGHYGRPLLLFPTAGGDAEEVERCGLVDAVRPFIEEGRVKVFSVDSIAGRAWLSRQDVPHCVWLQQQFDECLVHEVLPAIRADCRADHVEALASGASIGALNALIAVTRHPESFAGAICMSGTYDVEHWLQGQWYDTFYFYSPLHFLPGLPEDERLRRLRERFVLIATGQGDYENPAESWKAAHALGAKGIPNRVDLWDDHWIHDWPTWHAMLPKYLDEMLCRLGE